jgi:AAA+ superfamily predicted ATPase
MTIVDTALAIVAFVGLFATVEYATYRVMERKHKKRGIYRLFFMLAWTSLAFVHMWVVAPLLNLPPTAVVALGFTILVIFIIGGLGAPLLSSVAVIGLYPFALVYELFVVLQLLTEGVTLAASLVTISQLGFLSTVVPSDPKVQAALGLAVAASVVAMTYYDPQGENGYYYATGRYFQPSVDSEKVRQITEGKHSDQTDVEQSTRREEPSGPQPTTSGNQSRSESSRVPAKAPDSREYEYNWNHSDIGFDDIGGYYDVKERLTEEVLRPLRATAHGDDRYDRFGIEPSRGILFYGPPGTGKTLFARALAGELEIPFVELGPADVTSKWINEGPQRIRQLFEEARAIGPCVIFLDEAEHLFGGRDVGAGGAHAEDRKITSELLVHLTADGRTAIVVGATNRPEDIDPAILRPGRLATHIEIGLPGEESRQAIFESKLREVPHSLDGDDLVWLAEHTNGLTGAEIQELVDTAKRTAATRDAAELSKGDFPTADELSQIAATSSYDADRLSDPGQTSKPVDQDDDRDEAVGYQ